MSNKSILHVVNIYFVLPYFIGDQFLYFHDLGYDVHVICSPSNHTSKFSEDKKFKYKEIPILRTFSFFQDIKSIIAICKYIKLNRIDIVSGHTPKGALLSMVAAFVMRVPKRIYFRHGLVYETSIGLKRFILQNIDRLSALLATKIICVSPSVYNRSICDNLNSGRKQLVLAKGTCNGIDLQRFSVNSIHADKQNDLRTSLGIPNEAFVIGFTGRLVKDKGIIELVSAFEYLSKSHNNLYLLLVGMIEERDALPLDIIQTIHSNANIVYTGYVDNADIEYYYSLMSIFVLPSYREGFPTSVLEASSMELPIITTRATGCIDSIVENETGLFTEHNAVGLIEKIEIFIDDRYKIVQFGKNGRQFVRKYFDQHIIWSEIEKLYK